MTTEQRIAEGTWTNNDLPDLSPFKWADGTEEKREKVSKRGAHYTVSRLLLRPKNAAPGVVFPVEVFQEMARHIKILSAMNPDAWLRATISEPVGDEKYGKVIVSIE